MAEMLHIGADFFAALDDYVQAVSNAAVEAHEAGTRELRSSLQESARSLPIWNDVADDIDTWVDDGELRVGVRSPRSVKKAHIAEYGMGPIPPTPLLRNMPLATKRAGEAMDEVLHERLGIPRHR